MTYDINRDELMHVLQNLIRINSVNPYLDEDGPGERQIARYIAERLQASGLLVRFQPINDTAANVIGILNGTGGGKTLMLNGHMDTVSAKRMEIEPFEPRYESGRVYGRGSLDMKGSLAAMIAAVEAVKRSEISLTGDVILTFVADEEFKSIGTEELVKEYTADAAIVCEPTNLDIGVVHKGFAWIKCEVFGKSAHGSRPQEGVDAIVRAGRVLREIERLCEQLGAKEHPIVGPPSVHASLIGGGTELSTYPDYCKLELERRTIPGETEAEVMAEMEAIMSRLSGEDEQFRARYELFFLREPFEVSTEEPVYRCLHQAISNRLQRPPKVAGFSGWADSALLQGAGIPTVLFGPVGEGLHASSECVEFESLVDMAHVLAETIIDFCR
ncbi:ArgE/DapE family deacylase [Brevibacillus sp. H7]|uniref:ArgE/DapE family deacylase n=1 Tax=Brevibacillus sp. H7 TaxID=3349138 RepID=UPI0037F83F34